MENPVFVIVVWYNGLKWADKCLSSLMNSSYNLEVIVIDNGSIDGSQEYIQEHFPNIKLIQSDTNLGFGKANNIGITYALSKGANYFFLLNQDAWIEPSSIEKLVQIALHNKEYGIISPIHLNGSYTALDLNFSKNISPQHCPGFFSDLYLKKLKDLYQAENINAAAWLITKECIGKVGLFEPAFHLYGEDDNYVQRIKFHKFKLGVTPLVTICHDREQRTIVPINIKRKAHVNKLTLILNINNSYFKSYTRVLQYALYLLYKKLILVSLIVALDPVIKIAYYTKIRSKHKRV